MSIMVAKLVAEEGNLKGLVLSLDEGNEWIIGRDPDACQLLIEDPSASRKHLLCRSTSEGIVLENLSATNPVQVNDEEVKEPRLLQNGDAVKIGSGLFRFYAEAAAQLIKDEAPEINTTGESGSQSNGSKSGLPENLEPIMVQNDAQSNNTNGQEQTAEDAMEQRQDSIFEEEATGKDALAEIDFGLIDIGRWLLKVIVGPNTGAEFSMQTGSSYMIGTDPNACDIVFHDTSVSRQHARITINQDDTLILEDLKSRNGTFIDGEPLKTKRTISPNTHISMGTTTFVIYDREGEMQTIISPLMPSIVKTLQKEEPPQKNEELEKAEKAAAEAASIIALQKEELAIKTKKEKAHNALGAFILIGIITGLFVIAAIGTSTLFQSTPVVQKETVDTTKTLDDALAQFPGVKWTFNKNTGRLFLVGHVINASDKNQLLYNLQGLNFIKSTDDNGIIIDEYVWREINQVIDKNPSWKGISMHSPAPGLFVISGNLETRAQADRLSEFLSSNFSYLDLLEKKIVVDEDVANSINVELANTGFKDVKVQVSNGEVTLSGNIPVAKAQDFETILADVKNIPGLRSVKNLVINLAPESSIINISDKYEVTGISTVGGGNLNVVINGRILTKGDVLDGMTITNIKQNAVFLDKDGVMYRIDFSK